MTYARRHYDLLASGVKSAPPRSVPDRVPYFAWDLGKTVGEMSIGPKERRVPKAVKKKRKKP